MKPDRSPISIKLSTLEALDPATRSSSSRARDGIEASLIRSYLRLRFAMRICR
jgi:hypothetical protein